MLRQPHMHKAESRVLSNAYGMQNTPPTINFVFQNYKSSFLFKS